MCEEIKGAPEKIPYHAVVKSHFPVCNSVYKSRGRLHQRTGNEWNLSIKIMPWWGLAAKRNKFGTFMLHDLKLSGQDWLPPACCNPNFIKNCWGGEPAALRVSACGKIFSSISEGGRTLKLKAFATTKVGSWLKSLVPLSGKPQKSPLIKFVWVPENQSSWIALSRSTCPSSLKSTIMFCSCLPAASVW